MEFTAYGTIGGTQIELGWRDGKLIGEDKELIRRIEAVDGYYLLDALPSRYPLDLSDFEVTYDYFMYYLFDDEPLIEGDKPEPEAQEAIY